LVRPRSSSGKLDNTFASRSVEDLNEKVRRDHVARREQDRANFLDSEQRKADLKDEYHRNYSKQVQALANLRNESAYNKMASADAARKDRNSSYAQSFVNK
jgi:hypothetical protein